MSTGTDGPGFLATAIAALAQVCNKHPRTVLAAVALSCGLAIAYTAQNLAYHTHRNDLISKHKDYFQRWKKFVNEFGNDDDLVVVAEGKSREELRAAIEAVAARAQAAPEHFDRLHYKIDLRGLRDRALLYLPTDQLRAIQDHLRHMAMLLDPPVLGLIDPLAGWKHLTIYELLDKAALVNGPLNPEQKFQPERDPLLAQLNVICKNALAYIKDPSKYQSPWTNVLPGLADRNDMLAEPWYFTSADESLAFLMVRAAHDEGDGFVFAQKSIDALSSILGEVRAAHPNVQLGLTGIPVLENDEMISTQHDSTRASWLALLGVAILYFFVYRGLRYPLMTIASLLVGTAWALGWTTLTVGHLNILSSAFAVMLIGMGDYGVLWLTHFTQERTGGANPSEANGATALHVGPSIVTAALATALAFFATMLADLKAVAELGWIAGCGVLLCALSCFVVMPALLALFDIKMRPGVVPIQGHLEQRRRWLPGLMKRPGLVLSTSAVITLILVYCASNIVYDHNLLNLQSPSLPSVQWQHRVLEKSPEGNLFAISITNTPEEAIALKQRYETLPSVSKVIEVASLLPRDQDQKLEYLRDIQLRLRKLPPRGTVVPHELPDADSLARATDRMLAVVGPWQLVRPCAFLGELHDHLRDLRAVLASDQRQLVAQRLREFQVRIGRDLMDDLHRLRDVSTPAAITLADVPHSLRERYVGYTGKWMLAVSSKKCLWEYDNLREFVREIQTVDSEATGRPFTILEGLRAMRGGFLWAGVYALIAMVIVLLLDFGTAKHAAFAFLPLAMGMIVALGVMSLLGFSLNPANLIAFPLILGVGAENGVHVLHDFRNRRRGVRYYLSRPTGRGIMVAALTTILGFGTLMISSHRGMASLGLALTLGVTACMATALVCLPALLGWISSRRDLLHQKSIDHTRAA